MVGSPEQVLEATTRLATLREALPELARLGEPDLIKAGRRAAVFSALDDQRRVLVKLYYEDGGRDEARAAAKALNRVESWMDEGRDRVPLLFDHNEENGVLITEFAPGQRLDQMIAAHPERRPELIARAARWLDTLSRFAAVREPFQGRFWVKSRGAALEGLSSRDKDLGAALMSEIARLRDGLAGRVVAKYYAHGDWAPHNMILEGETLFGIDIAVRQPILRAKDIARFLVYLAAHVPGPPPMLNGLSERDQTAMASLPEAQDNEMMRFFIGVELADKLARNHDDGPVATRMREAIGAYL